MKIDRLPEAFRNRFGRFDHIAQDTPTVASDQDDEIERQPKRLTELRHHQVLGLAAMTTDLPSKQGGREMPVPRCTTPVAQSEG